MTRVFLQDIIEDLPLEYRKYWKRCVSCNTFS